MFTNFQTWDLITSSPLDHPGRSIFSAITAILCTILAMRLLGQVKTGVTLQAKKSKPLPFKIHKGKVSLSKKPKDILSSYNGPVATAILGLCLYATANFMIIIAFKTVEYYFAA